MDRVVVTAAGGTAWVLAVWLILRGRSGQWSARLDADDAPWQQRLSASTARVAGSLAAGMVAGALVLGGGSRVMMRVLAATSPESAQGRQTEAEETVGQVTIGGTIGLVLFVGILGGLLGVALYSSLRRWLPSRSLWAGLIVAGVGAGLFGRPTGLFDPDNRDFAILEPTWLAIAFALAVVISFALLGAVLIDRWAARWPRPSLSPRGVASVLPLAPLALAPPVLLAALGAIVLHAFVITRVGPRGTLGVLDRALPATITVAAAVGAVWVGVSSAAILS